jgi:hypothetical protein
MKKLIKICVLFLSINLLISCDCQKTATGIVYDADTKLPLAGVIYNGSNNITFENRTNEKGEFRILKMDGRRCKIIKSVFKKENYKTLKIKIRNRSEKNSIYLIVEKN